MNWDNWTRFIWLHNSPVTKSFRSESQQRWPVCTTATVTNPAINCNELEEKLMRGGFLKPLRWLRKSLDRLQPSQNKSSEYTLKVSEKKTVNVPDKTLSPLSVSASSKLFGCQIYSLWYLYRDVCTTSTSLLSVFTFRPPWNSQRHLCISRSRTTKTSGSFCTESRQKRLVNISDKFRSDVHTNSGNFPLQ